MTARIDAGDTENTQNTTENTQNTEGTKRGADDGGRPGLLRQSSLASIAAGLGLMSGLLLDASIAFRFGAGAGADAYFVGIRLPTAIATIALVAANQSLVPTFSTWLRTRSRVDSRRMASQVCLIATGVTTLLALGLIALAPLLIRVVAPGLDSDSRSIAVSVLRIAALTIPLAAAAEAVRAYLNAQYAFVAPALMNVVLNVVAAGYILGVAGSVTIAATALVIGGAARLFFVVLMGWRRGLRLSLPSRGSASAGEVTAALRRTLRPLATGGLPPVARLGEVVVLSFLPTGSISVVNYGTRLIAGAGGSVFFRSIMVALIPRVTERHAEGDDEGVRRITARGCVLMLAVGPALTALIMATALPLSLGVFRRGQFTTDQAMLLAAVLTVLALALPADALQRALLTPAFARLDTRTPFVNAMGGVLVNLALLPVLVLPFRDHSRAVLGVSAAFVVSQWVQAYGAARRLRLSGPLGLAEHRRALVVTVGTAAAVGLAGVIASHALVESMQGRQGAVLAGVLIGGVAALALALGYVISWRLGLRAAVLGLRGSPGKAA